MLSDAAHTELTSPQVSTHTIYADLKSTALGLGDDYGFGLGVSQGFFMDHRAEPATYYNVPVLGHGGDIPGFAATFAVLPSTGFGIVVLSNRDALRPIESIRMALENFRGPPRTERASAWTRDRQVSFPKLRRNLRLAGWRARADQRHRRAADDLG